MNAAWRCRFAKLGRARFFSHLDLMRIMTRSLRRVGLTPAYSGGFHPHARLSFGPALAVGLESCAECFDAVITEAVSAGELRDRLNAALPEGLCLLEAAPTPQGAPLAAYLDTAAYLIRVAGSGANPAPLTGLLQSAALPYERRGPQGSRTLDLRPLLLGLDFSKLDDGLLGLLGVTGARGNLRPEELLGLVCGLEIRGVMRAGLFHRDGERTLDPLTGREKDWHEAVFSVRWLPGRAGCDAACSCRSLCD